MNYNKKMNFLQFVMHDNKTVTIAAIALLIGMPIYWYNQQGEGAYMENTSFWLWLGLGVFLPLFILGMVIRSYRNYRKDINR